MSRLNIVGIQRLKSLLLLPDIVKKTEAFKCTGIECAGGIDRSKEKEKKNGCALLL